MGRRSYGKCPGWDDVVCTRNFDIPAANISPHGNTGDIQSKGFTKTQINGRESCLPLVNRNAGQNVFRCFLFVLSMGCNNCINLVSAFHVPLWVLG